jgi:hypothetical protein
MAAIPFATADVRSKVIGADVDYGKYFRGNVIVLTLSA